jgi:ribose-phosphate pyrophosphokinase
MVDTGGTLTNAIRALCDRDARAVYATASHALLSGPAVDRLSSVPLEELVVTNTIDLPEERRFDKLRTLSVAGLLANAIEYIHSNESVSALFEIPDEDS